MRTAIKSAGAVAALLLLVSCGNAPDSGQSKTVLKSLSGMVTKSRKGAGPVGIGEQQIASSLAANPNPMSIIVLEKRKLTSIVTQIETNGAYRTYGTPQRQSLTFRSGVITATRGLTGDLMSSEIGSLGSLLSARKSGQTQHVMRFLDGEDIIRETVYACTVTRGESTPIKQGVINTTGVGMIEKCSAGEESFTNVYVVDPSGAVVVSRQWLGDFVGYASVQALRK